MSTRAQRVIAATVAVLILGGGGVWLARAVGAPAVEGTPAPHVSGSSALPSATAPSASTSAQAAVPTATATTPTSPESTRPTTSPPTAAASSPAVKQVTVTVTFSGWNASAGSIVVGGYADTVETTGTCTLTLTSGGVAVSQTVAAQIDATTTSCCAVSVPGSKLTSGQWQAVLTYASPTSVGASIPVTVEVP